MSNYSNSRHRRGNNSSRSNRGSNHRSNNRGVKSKYGQYIDPAKFVKAAQPLEQTTYTAVNSFADFGFTQLLHDNLVKRGFTEPTQVQDEAIPHIMDQKDVVGVANTGTGKTAAFLLPVQHKMIEQNDHKLLVIAPTRELALQIQQESREFSRGARLTDTLLIGGTNIGRQIHELKRRPDIIIGTPGRLKDHLERGTLRLDDVQTVVIDEVDRMLDMGFVNDIRAILSKLPTQRQSLFFSATINDSIERLINGFSNSPVMIKAKTAETSDNVEQSVMRYRQSSDRMDQLHELLLSDELEKAIVFAETKRGVEKLSKELTARGFKADAMHGNKSQNQRQRALRSFRNNQVDILVATDVASRGIDVDGITHVINFDIPQSYDDYTHRVGRAGRNNQTGYAVTFVNR